jgi:hypothetical protein
MLLLIIAVEMIYLLGWKGGSHIIENARGDPGGHRANWW